MDAPGNLLHNMRCMPDDFTPLHFGHTPRCDAVVDKHFEGYWTIQLKTTGRAYLAYDQQRTTLDGPWAWPCYPGPRIRFGALRPRHWWHHRYLAFTGPCITRWQSEGLWLRDAQPLTESLARRLAAVFDDLHTHAARTDRLGRRRAANLLEHILILLADARATDDRARPSWLADVMARLGDVAAPEPDYDRLARAAGMSVSTFRRRFRAITGSAPHAYRLQCRIAAARAMLGDTDTPIKQIADELGYRDVFYFTRQFTQQAGVSPAAYRRSRQT